MQKKIITDQLQIALFPAGFTISNPSATAIKLGQLSYFDPETVSITPLPSEAPADINRVEISKKDKSFLVTVGKQKINIYWNNMAASESFNLPDNWQDTVQTILKAVTPIDTFERVGYITTVFRETEAPAEQIRTQFLNMELTSGEEIIDYNGQMTIVTDILGVQSNLHTAISTGSLTNDNEKKVILIKYDVNTRQTQTLENWNLPKVFEYIAKAVKDYSAPEKIFLKFFPDTDE